MELIPEENISKDLKQKVVEKKFSTNNIHHHLDVRLFLMGGASLIIVKTLLTDFGEKWIIFYGGSILSFSLMS